MSNAPSHERIDTRIAKPPSFLYIREASKVAHDNCPAATNTIHPTNRKDAQTTMVTRKTHCPSPWACFRENWSMAGSSQHDHFRSAGAPRYWFQRVPPLPSERNCLIGYIDFDTLTVVCIPLTLFDSSFRSTPHSMSTYNVVDYFLDFDLCRGDGPGEGGLKYSVILSSCF